MKKLICALVCGLMLVPLSAWGQKWIEPHTDKDGTQVEGHWQTPEDVRQEQYSTPGKINPYTGQFNPYSSSGKGPQSVTPLPTNSSPMKGNPYYSIPDYRYQGRYGAKPDPKVAPPEVRGTSDPTPLASGLYPPLHPPCPPVLPSYCLAGANGGLLRLSLLVINSYGSPGKIPAMTRNL